MNCIISCNLGKLRKLCRDMKRGLKIFKPKKRKAKESVTFIAPIESYHREIN